MSRELILLSHPKKQWWGSRQSGTDNPRVAEMSTVSFWGTITKDLLRRLFKLWRVIIFWRKGKGSHFHQHPHSSLIKGCPWSAKSFALPGFPVQQNGLMDSCWQPSNGIAENHPLARKCERWEVAESRCYHLPLCTAGSCNNGCSKNMGYVDVRYGKEVPQTPPLKASLPSY